MIHARVPRRQGGSGRRRIEGEEIRVWDPLVRVFHWTLVAAFATAYFTEEDTMSVHLAAGYTVSGLILFRVLWGFIGPRHARFSGFVCRPSAALTYLKETLRGTARRYLGHNPAGGAMVIALLVALTVTVITGFAVYGAHDGLGPFASWLGGSTKEQAHQWEEVHEFMANGTVVLIVFHVIGVVLSSLVHGENLPRAMLTGRKHA
jgi:cytochrome b